LENAATAHATIWYDQWEVAARVGMQQNGADCLIAQYVILNTN